MRQWRMRCGDGGGQVLHLLVLELEGGATVRLEEGCDHGRAARTVAAPATTTLFASCLIPV